MRTTTIMMTMFVCVIQLILKQAIAAVVMPEARSALVNVAQTDTTGGSSHDHHTFIVPPKKTPESKQNEMFPLKKNEGNTTYQLVWVMFNLQLNILLLQYMLYAIIRLLSSSQKSLSGYHVRYLKECVLIYISIMKKVFSYEETELLVIKYKDEIWFRDTLLCRAVLLSICCLCYLNL